MEGVWLLEVEGPEKKARTGEKEIFQPYFHSINYPIFFFFFFFFF